MTDYLQGVDLSTNTATNKNEYNRIYEWYINNKLHRLDGPAFIDGKKKIYLWSQDGKPHRLDGPAYINEKDKRYIWGIHGNNKTDEITKWLTDNEIDWRNMSMEEKVLLKVVFG